MNNYPTREELLYNTRPNSSLVACEGCGEPTEFDELYVDHTFCLDCINKTVLTYYCGEPECKHETFIATGIQARCPVGHFEIKTKDEDLWGLVERAREKEIARMESEPMETYKLIYSKGII